MYTGTYYTLHRWRGRMQVALHSHLFHFFIIILVVLDALIVLFELLLDLGAFSESSSTLSTPSSSTLSTPSSSTLSTPSCIYTQYVSHSYTQMPLFPCILFKVILCIGMSVYNYSPYIVTYSLHLNSYVLHSTSVIWKDMLHTCTYILDTLG